MGGGMPGLGGGMGGAQSMGGGMQGFGGGMGGPQSMGGGMQGFGGMGGAQTMGGGMQTGAKIGMHASNQNATVPAKQNLIDPFSDTNPFA
jgi:hypothetical protein